MLFTVYVSCGVGVEFNYAIRVYLEVCFVRGVAMAEYEEFWVRFAGLAKRVYGCVYSRKSP